MLSSSSARTARAVLRRPGSVTETRTAVTGVMRFTVRPWLSVASTCGGAQQANVLLATSSVTALRTVRTARTRRTAPTSPPPVISPNTFSALTPAVFRWLRFATEFLTVKTRKMKPTVISMNVMKTTADVSRFVSTLPVAGDANVQLATSSILIILV